MFNLKIKHLGKLAIAGSLLLAASCAAQHKPNRGPEDGKHHQQGDRSMMGFVAQPIGILFAGMDNNNDAITSQTELTQFTEAHWLSFNLTNGRELRSFDYQSWAETNLGRPEAMPSFIGFDTDLSGSISKVEFETCLRRNFNILDMDKNGSLTRSELLVKMPSMGGQQGQGKSQGNGRSGGGEGRPPPR